MLSSRNRLWASVPHTSAPRLSNEIIKVKWTPEGILLYKSIVGDLLQQLRDLFPTNTSETCFSLIIDCTNYLLNTCASKTNSVIKVANKNKKSLRVPKCITKAKLQVHRAYKKPLSSPCDPEAKRCLQEARKTYKKAVRQLRMKDSVERDTMIFDIMEKEPKSIFT